MIREKHGKGQTGLPSGKAFCIQTPVFPHVAYYPEPAKTAKDLPIQTASRNLIECDPKSA